MCAIGGEDTTQDGAGELRGEAVHVDVVPHRATHEAALATSELTETGFLVGAQAGQVVGVHDQHDVEQTTGREGVVEHEATYH